MEEASGRLSVLSFPCDLNFFPISYSFTQSQYVPPLMTILYTTPSKQNKKNTKQQQKLLGLQISIRDYKGPLFLKMITPKMSPEFWTHLNPNINVKSLLSCYTCSPLPYSWVVDLSLLLPSGHLCLDVFVVFQNLIFQKCSSFSFVPTICSHFLVLLCQLLSSYQQSRPKLSPPSLSTHSSSPIRHQVFAAPPKEISLKYYFPFLLRLSQIWSYNLPTGLWKWP